MSVRLAAARAALVLGALAGVPLSASSQATVPGRDSTAPAVQDSVATAPRAVAGRVVRPVAGRAEEPRPVPGVQVVLHRIGADGAGPLDSLRTGRDGRYAFRYRRSGAAEAVYIVSAEHDGIAYFAAALRDEIVSGDDAEIVVFDTTSAPLPIAVRARHVVLSAALEGERQVLEIYELSNDTLFTLVPGARERAVWTAIVPAPAHDFAVPADLGIAQTSLQLVDGRVLLFAPFTPGIRQVAFSYRIPVDSFPLRMPIERATLALEVMLEEPAASALAPGLAETDPVSVEGRTFRRFVASDVPENAVLVIDAPAAPPASRALPIAITLIAIGTVMLLVLARSFTRRGAALAREQGGR